MQGLIVSGANNFFTVRTGDEKVIRCSIKGKKLKDLRGVYNPLAPGDKVELEYDPIAPHQGQITALIPRRNGFFRWNQKTRRPQLLAANLDLLICVTTPANPPFRPRFIDRVLVQAACGEIPVLIALNKTDLGMPESVRERLHSWQQIGASVCAVMGQSGVGKSTLLNALDPHLRLKTADISFKYDRGIHTTTQGVLFSLTFTGKNGAAIPLTIIDTPGIRHFALWGIKPEEAIFYFPEMEQLAVQCSFGRSCSHLHERGCKVREALEEGLIHPDRYESWRSIREELEQLTAEDYT